MMAGELELSGRPLLATTRDAPLFVDREQDMKAIEEAVLANLNVLLLGARGSGKTTLLRRLARRLERRGSRAVFVEGSLATSPSELLGLIRARIAPEADARRADGATGESQLLLDEIGALAADVRGDERRHVVLLDEVSSPDIVHTVFGRLRDEMWQLPITWVVAGDPRDRANYLRPPADAFFSRVLTLDALDEKAALKLLRARISQEQASDELLRAIVAESSRFPRDLIRVATDVIVVGAQPEQLASSRAKREQVLDALGEPAQRVVGELEVSGPASASDTAFLSRLGFGRSRAVQIFRELERMGIVESSIEHTGQRPRKVYGLREDVT